MIENIDKLRATLTAKMKSLGEKWEGTVGYTAAYAIYVHENLEAHHPVGNAKFLEKPARENATRYSDIARRSLQQGLSMKETITLVCLALQRDSQQQCPVDTGNMKNSAFTRVERVG